MTSRLQIKVRSERFWTLLQFEGALFAPLKLALSMLESDAPPWQQKVVVNLKHKMY